MIGPDMSVQIYEGDGVYIKQLSLPKAGMIIEQHCHNYDHMTMLATGKVAVGVDGVYCGTRTAPTGILILANTTHRFEALVDNTLLYCIHNIEHAETLKELV
jgi:hypothetical protein